MAMIGRERYLSIRAKFIILFIFLILTAFMIIGTSTYVKYSAYTDKSSKESALQLVDQMRITMDRYVKELERITLAPLYDENVLQILNRHIGSRQQSVYLATDEELKMNLFISSLAFDRSEVESIMFFANDGSIFSNLDNSVKKSWDPSTNEWMEAVRRANGALAILPPQPAEYYVGQSVAGLSLARLIRQPGTNQALGFIKVDLKAHGLDQIFSSIGNHQNFMLEIINLQGEQVYSVQRGAAEQRAFPLPDGVPADGGNDAFISSSVVSDYSGLRLTGRIPIADLQKDARELIRFIAFVAIGAVVFAIALATVTSDRLVKPILHLQKKMRLVQKGSFKERAEVTTGDEIGTLTEVFNMMVGEIDRLVNEVYELGLREREAVISTLQKQMNPHFLYNTLESINMKAIEGDNWELSDIITSLGKLLRYTVDREERFVTLHDEIQFVESYLQIQSFRLGERLRTVIHIDAALQSGLVPKLILQPLVENVIEHAIGHDAVTVTITGKVADSDDLLLIVQDDGIGIGDEQAARIERLLYSPADMKREMPGGFGKVRHGFGLRNVHQRIRLLYGEPYGVCMGRPAAHGAEFQIRVPFRWGEN
ncbi:MAG: sensor histidine kinase [Paenibacillaceae bacterium]|nr:sensor histidine kinase [Paenibacillaceae bacterium]